jgi:predicted amidophosphoribosyltransferase
MNEKEIIVSNRGRNHKECDVCGKPSEYNLCKECTEELNNYGTIAARKKRLVSDAVVSNGDLNEFFHMSTEIR